jgi:hypothetical protein
MEKEFALERSNPPMSNPPMSNPPMSNPPMSNPPMSNPPMSNPPMSNPVEPEPCENIVLTVEEQNDETETTMEMPVIPDLSIIETKDSADDDNFCLAERELTETENLVLLEHENKPNFYKEEEEIIEEVQVKKEVEDVCGEMESDTLPDEEDQGSNEVAGEYSEPEVETEDEDEPQANEDVDEEESVKDEEEEVVETKEEDESEEEVFEIEIDEVTYYATSEDNGILYEMLEGGDIGKQVGTIQDGEPIFN